MNDKPEWKDSPDGWQYRLGDRVLVTIIWRSQDLAYFDGEGRRLDQEFNKARTAAERLVAGEWKGQGKLL